MTSLHATLPVALDHAAVRAAVARRREEFVRLLADFVDRDSGSLDPDLVTAFGSHVGALLSRCGWTVQHVPIGPTPDGRRVGHLLEARLAGRVAGGAAPTILAMAHLDTVFAAGEASRRPFSIDDRGHGRGPGVSDDKAGIVTVIVAVEVLRELGLDTWGELRLVCTPDEELGSPASRPVLAAIAEDVDVALCLEAARENGDVVSARKGIADLRLVVRGRAAHAGVEPHKGAHALLGAAHLVVALQALNGRWDGVTVNVGTLRGGSRPNVVPDHAELAVDLRAWDEPTFRAALAEVRAIAAAVPVDGVTAEVRVLGQAPPMVRTPQVAALAGLARAEAERLGFALDDARTGGAADANTTAMVGVPTLDGLAPIGGDDHGHLEWLDLGSVVDRVSLFACLLARLGAEGLPDPDSDAGPTHGAVGSSAC